MLKIMCYTLLTKSSRLLMGLGLRLHLKRVRIWCFLPFPSPDKSLPSTLYTPFFLHRTHACSTGGHQLRNRTLSIIIFLYCCSFQPTPLPPTWAKLSSLNHLTWCCKSNHLKSDTWHNNINFKVKVYSNLGAPTRFEVVRHTVTAILLPPVLLMVDQTCSQCNLRAEGINLYFYDYQVYWRLYRP